MRNFRAVVGQPGARAYIAEDLIQFMAAVQDGEKWRVRFTMANGQEYKTDEEFKDETQAQSAMGTIGRLLDNVDDYDQAATLHHAQREDADF